MYARGISKKVCPSRSPSEIGAGIAGGSDLRKAGSGCYEEGVLDRTATTNNPDRVRTYRFKSLNKKEARPKRSVLPLLMNFMDTYSRNGERRKAVRRCEDPN